MRGNLKKIIITLLVFFIIALIIDMQGPTPYIRWYFVLPKYGKVVYNNHSIEKTLELAKKNVDKNDLVSGYLLYKNVIKRQPDNIDAYVGIADLYGQAQNFKEAEKYIKEAEKLIKDDTPDEKKAKIYHIAALIYDGLAAYADEEEIDFYLKKSLEYFSKILNLKNLNNIAMKEYKYLIFKKLGITYYLLNDLKKSNYYFLEAYNIKNDDDLLYSIAVSYLRLGDFPNTEKYLGLYKQKFGEDNIDLLIVNGFFYLKKGKNDEAMDYFKKALNKDNNYSKVYLFVARCYKQMGMKDKAKENYKKAFDINPFYIREPEVKDYIKDLGIDVKEYEDKIKQIREEKYSQVIKW
ncbi:MAG: tetratricopeptide repeat protein [Caloramator sp.]|nr:tetratricopeptide repeat protein [Caloramator sp.]